MIDNRARLTLLHLIPGIFSSRRDNKPQRRSILGSNVFGSSTKFLNATRQRAVQSRVTLS